MLCDNHNIVDLVFIYNFQIKLAEFLKTSFSIRIAFANMIRAFYRFNNKFPRNFFFVLISTKNDL
jgi:hypothetical protein